MKVALIDPLGTSAGLNTGLAYMAANVLEKRPADTVRVFDFNNNNRKIEARIKEIKEYDIIAFSVKSFTLKEAFSLLGRINLRPSQIVIFGGPHLAIAKGDFLKSDSRLGAVLAGEGENSFLKFLSFVEGKEKAEGIPGLSWRDGERIMINNSLGLEEDLESLPFPRYDVFDSLDGRLDNYPLLTSRGCPYQCLYCSVGFISGRKWRKREVGSIISEIKAAREKYVFNYFFIIDDNFTLEKERSREFCKALIAEKLNLPWTLPNGIRADKVDETLISLMKSSGCEAISFGIESADPEVFNGLGKGETLEDISRAIALGHKYNLRVSGKFIIGLPGSTPESTQRSLHWAKRAGLREANWNLLVPYPGTMAYDFVKAHGRFIRPWEDGFHFGPSSRSTFEIPSYSAKEMERDQRRANVLSLNLLSFYDRSLSRLVNVCHLGLLAIRYDVLHFFSHFKYLFRRWRLRRQRFESL